MSNSSELFLETPPITIKETHIKVLKILLRCEEIEQSEILKELKIDKSVLSKAITDLNKLELCKKDNNGYGNNLIIKKGRRGDIENFIGRWQFLSKHYLFRPHDIIIKGVMVHDSSISLKKLITSLSREDGVKYIPSGMNYNTQHIFKTPGGNITFYGEGNSLKVEIEDFVLPLYPSDIVYLEDYIFQGIKQRWNQIVELLYKHCRKLKISISNIYRLKNIHLGLIVSKELSRVIDFKQMLKVNNLKVDDSIYGVKEIEANGPIEPIITNMVNFIQDCTNAQIDLLSSQCSNSENITEQEEQEEAPPISKSPITNKNKPRRFSSPFDTTRADLLAIFDNIPPPSPE